MVIAACLYYLDKSESLAWIETFNGELQELLNRHKFLPDMEPDKFYKRTEAYQTYVLLYCLIGIHKHEISRMIRTDDWLYDFIQDCQRQYKYNYSGSNEIPDMKPGRLLNSWKQRAGEFLQKCKQINKNEADLLS